MLADLFLFGPPPAKKRGVLLAAVSAGLHDRAALFDALAQTLQLPDYFGRNWDALDECLRDLSWLKPKTIVIAHADLPLTKKSDRTVYLEILGRAVEDWNRDGAKKLSIYFPLAEERTVRRHLD